MKLRRNENILQVDTLYEVVWSFYQTCDSFFIFIVKRTLFLIISFCFATRRMFLHTQDSHTDVFCPSHLCVLRPCFQFSNYNDIARYTLHIKFSGIPLISIFNYLFFMLRVPSLFTYLLLSYPSCVLLILFSVPFSPLYFSFSSPLFSALG